MIPKKPSIDGYSMQAPPYNVMVKELMTPLQEYINVICVFISLKDCFITFDVIQSF